MTDHNPYQPPSADVARAEDIRVDDSAAVISVADGQKLVIYSILLNLVALGISIVLPIVAVPINLIALVVSLIGIVKVSSGLRYHLAVTILLVVLMFVPLINLITLLLLNARAPRRLRQAGYRVGLMGAKMK